ncbi:MAG: vWA domain-containing protein [Gemmataceae bacterium]
MMIVLDITGSMDWAIKSIDQEVQLLVDHVKNGKLDVQFGITVFRDELMRSPDDARAGITDDPFTFHFKGRPYTTDGAEIKRVLSLLKANGGGDGPENSFEGLRLAADAICRPGATKVQILITDAEPKPWPMYEDNLAKTQNHLLTKKVGELFLITTDQHRPIYQKLWTKMGGAELRGEWHDIRNLSGKPGVFRTMIQNLETRIFTAIADREKREAEK